MSGRADYLPVASANCNGEHRFFVAETGIDAKNQIVIILVCTACGEGIKREFAVEGSYTKKA